MSIYDDMLKKPVKILTRNKKIRTLDGNERYVVKLNSLIDDMYTYMPAQQFAQHLRNVLRQYKTIFKDDAKFLGIIASSDTSLGNVSVISSPKSIASNRELIFQALHRIGMLDIFELDKTKYVKNYIQVNTSSVARDKEVTNNFGKLIQSLEHNLQSCYVHNNEENPLSTDEEAIIKLVGSRLSLMKDIAIHSKKYLIAYNGLKETFVKATDPNNKYANFPLRYVYRGVMIGWSSLTYQIQTPTLVQMFLRNYDIKNTTTFQSRYKKAITEITAERNQYMVVFLLDDIDYEDDDVDC